MTTTLNGTALSRDNAAAPVKDRLKALASNFDAVKLNLATLVAAIEEGQDSLKAVVSTLQANEDNAWTKALSGIATTPGVPQVSPSAPTYNFGPAAQAVTLSAPVSGKPANLTEEARKLIHTGHSYTSAIGTLTSRYPDREREHIRRAVGRANGGK